LTIDAAEWKSGQPLWALKRRGSTIGCGVWRRRRRRRSKHL